VVLMHGSGGGTKDGDVGPNKVYREMAWALGARGVAVLRYDKRLTAHAARARALGRPLTMDEDQTDDGVAAARLLQHTEGVDPRRVHVLAVSQSTAVAADVAARVAQAGGPPLAGLVLVSASARGPAQMIREQTAYGARVARQRGDSAGLREALAVQAEAERMARADLPDSARVLGMDLGYWRSMDPRRTWRETAAFLAAGGRVFVASGARDFQTTAGDFAAWRQATARAWRDAGAAFAMVPFTRRFGPKVVHAVCLTLAGASMLAIPAIQDRGLLFLPMVGVGLAWASIMGNPYVMLAGSIPPERTGVYMGIFNMFIVIPMLIQVVSFKFVYGSLLGGEPTNAIRLAGALLLCAAVAVLFVRTARRVDTVGAVAPTA